MVTLQAFPLFLLLLVVTAAGFRTVDGSPSDKDENELLVSSGVPTSNPPTFSPNDTQQLTTESSEDYDDDDYTDEHQLLELEELRDGTLPAKVQPVVKPKNDARKKKGSKKSKSKGKRRKNGKKKQEDPCKTDYKDYCIHGKCQYLKDLKKPSCVCLPGYQNERCGIQALPTGTNEERIDGLSIVLVVAAVMLVIFILTAVTVVVTLQIRRKMRVEHDILNEEKQRLRTENGIVV
ncbi:proheparin-binding EGF-like growth factor [Heterodontus francisci]|uniref:proheparin-binding EGF-like growth factor n=1 Tax=Heterodontus francisci TaxID=7792 RepID=UPI00355B24AF